MKVYQSNEIKNISLMGSSGSGKTTLVNLLLHFFQVEDGMIFFDGQDINKIPLHILRKNIAYVSGIILAHRYFYIVANGNGVGAFNIL